MGVVRHLPVLVEQLLRVAARPAVDPVYWLTALLTVVTAATPAVVTTIIIQGYVLSMCNSERSPFAGTLHVAPHREHPRSWFRHLLSIRR
jgi:hypothetical protein